MKIKVALSIALLTCMITLSCYAQNRKTTTEQAHLLPAKDDKVYTGDVKLYTQKDVDNFGKNGYTFIAGNFHIESPSTDYSEELLDTRPLASIRMIDGELLISRLRNLVSVEGFKNLEQVNGDFTLSGCGLKKIGAIDKLSLIKGSLTIGNNTGKYGENGLLEIVGFNKLTDVESIYISGNSSVKKIEGFNALEKINTLQIMSVGVEEISNFKKLKTVKENFSVEYASALKKIILEKLESVDGYFALNENNKINGNIHFPSLKKIKQLYFLSNKNFDNYCDIAPAIRQQKIDSLRTSGNKLNPTKEQILNHCK